MKPPRELARVRIMEEATVTVPLDPNLSIKALAGLAARSVPQRYLIWPAKEIARVCGVHDRTIRRWAKDPEHPLKVIHLGHGLTTTLSLLDQWVIERWEEEGKTPRPRRGRPLRGGSVSEGKRWGVEVRVPRPEGETEA